MRRRCAVVVGVSAATIALSGCVTQGPGSKADPNRTQPVDLTVSVVADGLENPWDVAQAPDGTLIVDERGGGLTAIPPGGRATPIEADFDDLFARGETGLMGLVLDPSFESNRRLYTCQGSEPAHDIRVIAWQVSDDYSRASRAGAPLVDGLPLSSGRHGGCRLRFDADGLLRISVGDAARGENPQDLASLGGKTLRVNASDGSPAAGNPFLDVADENTKLIYSLGHRNVQGLALQPGTGAIYAVEHGPNIDDEVNVLAPGANFGWNPVGSASGDYDESVPMTDPAIDGAVPAIWSSGSPTTAVSGATFLTGEQWGELDGALAVAALKAQHLMVLTLGADGSVASESIPTELDGTYGRLRTAQLGTDGALYLTTDNGSDDKVLKVESSGG